MKLEDLASEVERKIKLLTNATSKDIESAEREYSSANSLLKQEIAVLKNTLVSMELIAGDLQYAIPEMLTPAVDTNQSVVDIKPEPTTPPPSAKVEAQKPAEQKPAAAPKKPTAAPKGGKAAGSGDEPVDISRIDMRVGKILEVGPHPDADSLYVEKVDLGEGHLRTILSGLVHKVPIEKMQGLVGIFMCNLKPVKMRGIESQGMLMCATGADDTVEPLAITKCSDPNGPAIGDRVYVEEFPGEPDAQLNPKKKVFERVKPDLRVDNHIATYKGCAWRLKADPKAVIRAPTVTDGQIS